MVFKLCNIFFYLLTDCTCNINGTVNGTKCNYKEDGTCDCKFGTRSIEGSGEECNECKPGFWDFGQDSRFGCKRKYLNPMYKEYKEFNVVNWQFILKNSLNATHICEFFVLNSDYNTQFIHMWLQRICPLRSFEENFVTLDLHRKLYE